MDCRSAQLKISELKTAEAVREEEPVWAELADHLDGCPDCDRLLLAWDGLDDRIADAMQAVEVPLDGPAGVLDAIASVESPAFETTADHSATPAAAVTVAESDSVDVVIARPRFHRWKLAAAAIACVGLLCVVIWRPDWTTPPNRTWDVAAVQLELPLTDPAWSGLTDFDRGFEFELPEVGWSRLPMSPTVKGWSFDGDLQHELAVVEFQLPAEGSRPAVHGFLAAVPAGELSAVPAERFFDPSTVSYAARGEDHFATVAWTEGETVYICFVPEAGGTLERLAEALQSGTV